MPEQFADSVDVRPAPAQPTGEGVAQIVDVQILDAGIFGRVSEGY